MNQSLFMNKFITIAIVEHIESKTSINHFAKVNCHWINASTAHLQVVYKGIVVVLTHHI